MKQQTTNYRVPNFGNDRDYETVDALLAGLRENYTDDSVAIQVKTGSGMLLSLFVDVDADGNLVETYPTGVPPTYVTADTLRALRS